MANQDGGNIIIGARIDTTQLQKDVEEVKRQIQSQADIIKGIESDKAASVKKTNDEIAKSVTGGAGAYAKLVDSLRSAQDELNNFRAGIIASSKDGTFSYAALTDAQKLYFDGLQTNVRSLEGQIKVASGSVKTFSGAFPTMAAIASDAIKKINKALKGLVFAAIIVAIGTLINKFREFLTLTKQVDGVQQAHELTIRGNVDAMKEQEKQYKAEALAANARLKLSVKVNEARLKELDTEIKMLETRREQLGTFGKFGAEGTGLFIKIKQRTSEFNELNETLKKHSSEVVKAEDAQKSYSESIQQFLPKKTAKELKGNLEETLTPPEIDLRTWFDKYKDEFNQFQASLSGKTAGIFGAGDVQEAIRQTDQLRQKQIQLRQEYVSAKVERQNAIEKEIEDNQRRIDSYNDLIGAFAAGAQELTQGAGGALEQFGETLAKTGGSFESALNAFGKFMIQTAIQVYSSVADQLIAWGTLAQLAPQQAAAQGLSPAMLGQGLAMKVTAGILKGLARYETGGIVGGRSFSGDQVLARVNSGEGIFTREQMRNLAPVGAGNTTVNVINNTQSKVSTRSSQNGKTIDILIDEAVAGKINKTGSATNAALRGYSSRPLTRR